MDVLRILLLFLLFTPIALFAAPCGQAGTGACISLQGSGGINRAEQQDKPYVILVSLDGFRADYLDRFDLPHFQHLIQNGVRAEGLLPLFPMVDGLDH